MRYFGHHEYLRLLDCTGRQTRPDKRGAIPGELAPILSRLQLSADEAVAEFAKIRGSDALFRPKSGDFSYDSAPGFSSSRE